MFLSRAVLPLAFRGANAARAIVPVSAVPCFRFFSSELVSQVNALGSADATAFLSAITLTPEQLDAVYEQKNPPKIPALKTYYDLVKLKGKQEAMRAIADSLEKLTQASQSVVPVSSVRYHRHGDPQQVLQLDVDKTETVISEPLRPDEVLVRWLMCPVNAHDMNMVEGLYESSSQSLPAVGGSEGVGMVVKVGANVKNMQSRDWVIPARFGLGTWRTHSRHSTTELDLLPDVAQGLAPEIVCALAVNPMAALLMLEENGSHLQPGDYIIQNGANSVVGQSVIQFARDRQLKTINIVRDRGDKSDKMIEYLKYLGGHGTICVNESYLSTYEYKRLISDIPKPRLALNLAGGELATETARSLAPNSTMVTYGSMSRKPVTVPSSMLVYKNLTLRGFSLSRWMAEHTKEERMKRIVSMLPLVANERLKFHFERRKFSNFKDIKAWYGAVDRDRKIIMNMLE